MTPLERAVARSRAYALFARLYRNGPAGELAETVRTLPPLAPLLPEPLEADSAAADHYALLRLDVLPYATLFLDAFLQLGGPVTGRVQEHYRLAGLPENPGPESADHLGYELDFLAFLTAAEAEAIEDRLEPRAEQMRGLQRGFLDTHLLWWLPVMAGALQHAPPFYERLATLTLELALEHRAALGHGPEASGPTPALPEPPPLLERPETGLKEIGIYLATPAWSGLYLGRGDVARLARRADLPHGFGGRALMLANLLRTAATYDQTSPLTERLLELVAARRAHLDALAQGALPVPPAVARAWRSRLDRTAAVLERIRAEAGAGG